MIFLDTNVISDTLQLRGSPAVAGWLAKNDAELAVSTVALAELYAGIEKIRPSERSHRLEGGLEAWRRRLAGRIFPFTEEAARQYALLVGPASRRGVSVSMPDGMIAAIARIQGGRLATRNITDFATFGLDLINPWQSGDA